MISNQTLESLAQMCESRNLPPGRMAEVAAALRELIQARKASPAASLSSVYVRGHKRAGRRTITRVYSNPDGSMACVLDRPVGGLRNWSVNDVVTAE